MMAFHLGIDTSNYAASLALYEANTNTAILKKQFLPVAKGKIGLQQSEAVFHHVALLPGLVEDLFTKSRYTVTTVGVSDRPRNKEGSYMPCFTVGLSYARTISKILGIRYNTFSHQQGHIASALYSAKKLELLQEKFIAFHVSGGTTEAVLVTPDEETLTNERVIARSLDLKAGQAVDRVGNMLGIDFPAGRSVDALAQKCSDRINIKLKLAGRDCSLSGVENQCKALIFENAPKEYVARYVIEYIKTALGKMTEAVLKDFGNLPLVFSGGVMSNSIIRSEFSEKYGAHFATPELSSDNALGTAILSSIKAEHYEQ